VETGPSEVEAGLFHMTPEMSDEESSEPRDKGKGKATIHRTNIDEMLVEQYKATHQKEVIWQGPRAESSRAAEVRGNEKIAREIAQQEEQPLVPDIPPQEERGRTRTSNQKGSRRMQSPGGQTYRIPPTAAEQRAFEIQNGHYTIDEQGQRIERENEEQLKEHGIKKMYYGNIKSSAGWKVLDENEPIQDDQII